MPLMPEKQAAPDDYTESTVVQGIQSDDDHWIEDPEDVFKEIVKLLEGYEWNDEKKKYEKHTSRQMMNRQGKQPSKVFLTGAGNKLTYITDMDKDEVTSYLKENHFSLAEHLLDHYEEYGIDFKDLGLVFNALMNPIWTGAKRAEGGSLMRFKKNTEKREHRVVRNQGNDKKGGLGGILPW